MCTVKTGRQVTNELDLQNLITSVILQQSDGFEEDSIVDETLQLLDGSRMNKINLVSRIVSKTLMIFVLNNILHLDHGRYQSIDYVKAI